MEITITIRPAGSEDAALIADISRRTFYDSFAPANTEENMRLFLDVQMTREKQIAEVTAPGRIFLLALWQNEPVGYASLRESDFPGQFEEGKAIEIVQLYSETNMIGKGVGKALMQACLEVAREKGKQWVWLGVWEHNQRAIGFYQKWGFERFGEHIFFVGLDAQTDWWMKRKL
jgi:diamine N-acetyltransferase